MYLIFYLNIQEQIKSINLYTHSYSSNRTMHQVIGHINQARSLPERTAVNLHQYLAHKYSDNYLTAYGKRIDTF